MAVHMTFVAHLQLEQSCGQSLDDLLGPLRVTVNGRIPRARARALRATRWALVTMLFRYSRMILAWRLRGDHRQSPFFSARTGRPILPPIERGRLVTRTPQKKLATRRSGCG